MAITLSRRDEIIRELQESGKSRVLSYEEREAFFKPTRGIREKIRKMLPPQQHPPQQHRKLGPTDYIAKKIGAR
ncbi:hypothetical protein L3C95_23790 [Chitinophaga filiformis]|uniref:hypothetical protein n=1 Tax=Chitinophaga filiformis TaxID=104663 RepID=UPI001F1A9711|nr:hypothetical protein [Chitinophaga filiformis]MCF6405943.1 hypothetical protein [Chitinophaga filiformis]